MILLRHFPVLLTCASLHAGTVVITSVPDENHPLDPLTDFAGVPLEPGGQVRVGAFPGLNDAQVLDLAAQGLAAVEGAFVSFGDACQIGQGVEGADGVFEIAVTDDTASGETVTLLIQQAGGEFLIARFPGAVFEAETDTGLPQFLTLHLADANLLIGDPRGESALATTAAPATGSFDTWIASFASITDPLLRLPGADADSDGRSNFLEYATGGNPASGDDPAPLDLTSDGAGGYWLSFSRLTGIGTLRYSLESSDLAAPWTDAPGTLVPDPSDASILRLHLPAPLPDAGFYRLQVEGD